MLSSAEFDGILNDQTITCVAKDRHDQLRTPFLYPDGDNIDLFIAEKNGQLIVSDLGETLRWLRSQNLSPRRTPKRNALIADACLTHGIEQYKGVLLARCRPGDSLPQVTLRVAQACLRVSDLWFTFRTRVVESMADEVADFLAERDLRYDRRPKLAGRCRARRYASSAAPIPAIRLMHCAPRATASAPCRGRQRWRLPMATMPPGSASRRRRMRLTPSRHWRTLNHRIPRIDGKATA